MIWICIGIVALVFIALVAATVYVIGWADRF